MSERERLARRLEEIALPGQAGDHERIVAYTLRYGSETMSGDAAFAAATPSPPRRSLPASRSSSWRG
jgi:hypothetical protein